MTSMLPRIMWSLSQTLIKNSHQYLYSRECAMLQTMFCSCNHFERTGLPCVHQACVATYCHQFASNSPSVFKGFTHHDISVRWWSSYMYFAYKSSTPPEMVHKFHALAVKDIMGPKLRCHIDLSLIAIVDLWQPNSNIRHIRI